MDHHNSKRVTMAMHNIVARNDLQFRDALDPEWVAYLAENWESVNTENPIEAVETEETEPGTVGCFTQHRLAAARELGLAQVTVVVHECSHDQAIELAAASNLDAGKPYSPRERERAIKAILQVNPMSTYEELAVKSKSSKFVAKEIAHQLDLERRNPVAAGDADTISPTVLRVIGRSKHDERTKDELVAAARQASWTKDQARFGVAQVDDPAFSVDYRRRLLAGEIQPLMVSREELPSVAQIVESVTSPKQSREENAVLAAHAAYTASRSLVDRLEQFGLPDLEVTSLRQLLAESVTIAEAARALQGAVEAALPEGVR